MRPTLQDVAETPPASRLGYIEALEDLRLDELPLAAVSIGCVKSYAKVLGLDGDAAVARFKLDAPDDSEPLRAGRRAPERDRLGLILALGAVIVAAIVLWNVAQRAIAKDARRPRWPRSRPPPRCRRPPPFRSIPTSAPGSVSLGAPLLAQSSRPRPEPYKTPGLDDAANGGSADAVSAASKARAAEAAKAGVDPNQAVKVGAPFRAKGAVWRDSGQASGVILQARKAGSTVHDAAGALYFTRWMSAGEAFHRAPA